MCDLNEKCPPPTYTHTRLLYLNPWSQLVALFGEVMEPLKGGALLGGYCWEQALKVHSLAWLLSTPVCR